jgi:hypothetical protein
VGPKPKVHKRGNAKVRPGGSKKHGCSNVKPPLPKPGSSNKSSKPDKGRPISSEVLKKGIDAALENHSHRIGKPQPTRVRTISELMDMLKKTLEEDGWPDNIWLWKNTINHAELMLLRRELLKIYA